METGPRKIDTILCEAVEIESAAERAAFLDKVCGEDAELRHRLDKLIADHFKAGDFLEEPPAALAAAINQPITEGPGTVIGPYKLLQNIGEGGLALSIWPIRTSRSSGRWP